MSHFYSMSYQTLMAMPIRAFWLMSGNIRRVRAGEDIRELMVGAAAQSPEGLEDCRNRLVLEMGDVFKGFEAQIALTAERDEAGFAELKNMAMVM